MKLKVTVILALMALVGLSTFAAADTFWGKEQVRISDNENEPYVRHVVEQLDGNEVNTQISRTEAFGIVKGLGFNPVGEPKVILASDNAVDRIVWVLSWSQSLLFTIDANTAEIVGIADYSASLKSSDRLTDTSPDNLVSIATKKLKNIVGQLPPNAGKANVEIDNDLTRADSNDKMYRVTWTPMSAIPIEKSFLRITLDSFGNMRHYVNRWAEPDVDRDPIITKDQAITIAKKEATSLKSTYVLGDRLENADRIYAELTIKKPFNLLDESKPIVGDYRLIWDVTFAVDQTEGCSSQDDTDCVPDYVRIAVDAHSGQIVGTDFSK